MWRDLEQSMIGISRRFTTDCAGNNQQSEMRPEEVTRSLAERPGETNVTRWRRSEGIVRRLIDARCGYGGVGSFANANEEHSGLHEAAMEEAAAGQTSRRDLESVRSPLRVKSVTLSVVKAPRVDRRRQ